MKSWRCQSLDNISQEWHKCSRFSLGNEPGWDDLLRHLPDLCLYKLYLNWLEDHRQNVLKEDHYPSFLGITYPLISKSSSGLSSTRFGVVWALTAWGQPIFCRNTWHQPLWLSPQTWFWLCERQKQLFVVLMLDSNVQRGFRFTEYYL